LIFTSDSIIALSIFLISLVVFYSYFIEASYFEISGSKIYADANNNLYIHDKGESHSSAYNLYQKGDITGALMVLNLTLDDFPYDANLILFKYNGSGFEKVLQLNDYSFDSNFVLRRYLVYTLSRSISKVSNNVEVDAESQVLGENMTVDVSVYNPKDTAMTVDIKLKIFNHNDTEEVWDVYPTSKTITINSYETNDTSFEVVIPNNTPVDTYYVKAVVTGGLSENATDPFNVFDFGLVELEVGI